MEYIMVIETVSTLHKVAEALGCPISNLIGPLSWVTINAAQYICVLAWIQTFFYCVRLYLISGLNYNLYPN